MLLQRKRRTEIVSAIAPRHSQRDGAASSAGGIVRAFDRQRNGKRRVVPDSKNGRTSDRFLARGIYNTAGRRDSLIAPQRESEKGKGE